MSFPHFSSRFAVLTFVRFLKRDFQCGPTTSFTTSTRNESTTVETHMTTTSLAEAIAAFDIIKQSENFNRVGRKVVPIAATSDTVVCEMKLEEWHLNTKGTLHGGLTACLTDIITTRAVGLTLKNQLVASVELSVSYFLPVRLGDTVQIKASVLRKGKNIVFTEAEFRRKSDGKLATIGKHTLALLPPQHLHNM